MLEYLAAAIELAFRGCWKLRMVDLCGAPDERALAQAPRMANVLLHQALSIGSLRATTISVRQGRVTEGFPPVIRLRLRSTVISAVISHDGGKLRGAGYFTNETILALPRVPMSVKASLQPFDIPFRFQPQVNVVMTMMR